MSDQTAVFLGRFQPIHLGHYFAVRDHEDRYDKVVIAVGSPEKSRTDRNPLDLTERRDLLNRCLPEHEKIPVKDEDRGEAGYPDWGQRLVEKTGADVVITQNNLVKKIVREHTEAEVEEHKVYCPERFSGTVIRERIRNRDEWENFVPAQSRGKIKEYTDIIRRAAE